VIDHVTISVSDLEASRRFYARALEPLDGPDPMEGGAYLADPDENNIEADFHDRTINRG
jgi:hypothetical protein